MSLSEKRWWRMGDTVLAMLFVTVAAWFCYGFLSPDPRLHNWEVRHSRLFTLLIRLGIYAVVAAGLVFLPLFYIAVRSGRLRLRSVLAFVGLILVGGLVAYLPLSVLYEEKMANASPVHPYLQIFPPEMKPEPKRANELRVVCLGGSTTEWGAEKGDRWTDLLEAQLAGRFPDRSVNVINQGREWFTTQHSLINYETNVRRLQPDVVVVMHAINDFMVNADHSYYAHGPFREDYGNHSGPLTRVTRNRSLMRFAAEVFRGVWYHQPRTALEVTHFPGLRPFERNLMRLAQLAELDGAKFVLMTQANLYKESYTEEEQQSLWLHTHNSVGPRAYWTLDTARSGMRQYNDATRSLAHRQQLPLVDLERAVPKTLEYLMDDCHYRAPAMPLIAEQVAEVIAPLVKSTVVSR